MLKILGRKNSINVRKVLWLADELGLEYEQEDWGRGFRDTKEADYLKLNPTGFVPTLVDGDNSIWESHTIMRHLATSRDGGAAWYPDDHGVRTAVDQWLDWALGWPATFTAMVAQGKFFGVEKMKDPTLQAYAEGGLDENIAFMTRILEQRQADGAGYLVGTTPTLADIPAGLYVNRWCVMNEAARNSAPLQAYLELLSLSEHNQRYSGPDQL